MPKACPKIAKPKHKGRTILKSSQILLSLLVALTTGGAASAKLSKVKTLATYCNPLNLDYAFVPDKDYAKNNCHRSTADPVCILYKDKYYLFATNQEGYWWSKDLSDWHFVSHFFKENGSRDQVCAPAAWPTSKGILFLPCFLEKDTMPLYISDKPETGKWREAVATFPVKTWDPSIFEDDDKRLYLYWGSSNLYPLYGVELDPEHGYAPIGKTSELFNLHPDKHGWEQFGENNQHGKMDPFIEGAWMNKFQNRYYLQYGAPGTEWNVYGDGVYTSDKPLGPFVYQAHNPFSWKPTGFIRGAGHGSTFADKYGNLWHATTMTICLKYTFERRLGLFPAGVDKDGVLYADTAFGDYPHYIAAEKQRPGMDTFTGWMLLSYKKRCWASPSSAQHVKSNSSSPNPPDLKNSPQLAFDEDIKTYWSADDAAPGRFLAVDLGKDCEVRAIQLNYADEQATVFGKQLHKRHRYQIFQSMDGESWQLLIDKSKNNKEVPHDYIELKEPVSTRYIKVVNIEMPTGHFAVGDLRVFGRGPGEKPEAVSQFSAVREKSDKRNVHLSWQRVPGAYAYNISFGVAPDKLYSSMLIYERSDYCLHSLNTDSQYFFKIAAVNEAGISKECAASTIP